MANQRNSIIATQTDHFRGLSTISLLQQSTSFPQARAISGAVYGVNIVGGISGTFSVHILGSVGGSTYIVAGLTALAAAGQSILYPAAYDNTGAFQALETVAGVTFHRIDQIVPPATVVFEHETVGTNDGVSASITVSASLYSEG